MYEYDATVIRVIDGDTIELELTKCFNVEIDFGFYIKENQQVLKSTRQHFRLAGINTPEIYGVSFEEKLKGIAAKDELTRLLSLGKLKAVTSKPDKYGRWLAELFVELDAGEKFSINKRLVETGFAVEYMIK
jgi:endonuclease YncB( thermonuclease family)